MAKGGTSGSPPKGSVVGSQPGPSRSPHHVRPWSSGARVGEASNPGPECFLSSISTTALMLNAELVAQLDSQIIALQEHATSAEWVEAAKARMAGLGYRLILTGVDPGAGKATGG